MASREIVTLSGVDSSCTAVCLYLCWDNRPLSDLFVACGEREPTPTTNNYEHSLKREATENTTTDCLGQIKKKTGKGVRLQVQNKESERRHWPVLTAPCKCQLVKLYPEM